MTIEFNGKQLPVIAVTSGNDLVLRISGMSMVERAVVNGKVNAETVGRLQVSGAKIVLDTTPQQAVKR